MTLKKIAQAKKISGTITVPGDKSITHRAFILASLARGESYIRGALEAEDCLRTKEIMQILGAKIQRAKPAEYRVTGTGLNGLKKPETVLDVGNSGTSLRLLTGLLAAQKFSSTITGDESIQKRPMQRIIDPLSRMGAVIESLSGLAPLKIKQVETLRGIIYPMPMPSAQVKSCLMLAGLYAQGETTIIDPGISRDHTERLFKYFGLSLKQSKNKVTVAAAAEFAGKEIIIPGDFSSAAFFIAAGLIHHRAKLTIKNVGLNPTRCGLLEVIKKMGGDIKIKVTSAKNESEPRGDVIIKSSKLKGSKVSGSLIPTLIDEIPVLAVIASQAKSTTVIKDARELRVKESDRIKSTVSELKKFGINIKETEDGMIIEPSPNLTGAQVESHGDHRIAMSCAVAGLIAKGETVIDNIDCVNTSFPDFWKLLGQIC